MTSDPPPTLFETPGSEPLAARMRPRVLDEFIGQDHIVGPGRLLRRAIEADQLSSLIFYGPPGTGKTTLARVIANSTKARFIAINAVLAGVKDIRESVAAAQASRRAGVRTILFVDEVHRFNKAQQDALLPWVENGTVILVGATTENPFFEVNKALVSRSRVFQLKPLSEDDLRAVARQTVQDKERGYGRLQVELTDEALDHLVNVANGDARGLLNALELAVETTPPDENGVIAISREVAEESIQQRAVLYDKEGDAHFDTISAFIKSVRGSDPDAALYWLAKMVYAGEDPRFIFRRLLILASEDVGLADPQALAHTAAAAQAYDYVGLPEGRFHLAQATLYLANAAKSNSTMGFFDALDAVAKEREAEVPAHLRDGNRDHDSFGHGAGYAYPHAYRDHWVAQQYLPEALQGKLFYQPSRQGQEALVKQEVERRREAQLAAMLEGGTDVPGEVLTVSPRNLAQARWLQRTVSRSGARLAAVRDAIFEAAAPQAHDIVLDLKGGTGLLTWEALRRAPEGQVWVLETDATQARSLNQQADNLPELSRPVVLERQPWQLSPDDVGAVRFDTLLGRNSLAQAPDVTAMFASLREVSASNAVLVLAENDARRAQRLYRLLDWSTEPDLLQRLQIAEEAIYAGDTVGSTKGAPTEDQGAPVQARLGHSAAAVKAAAETAGWRQVRVNTRTITDQQLITSGTVEAWFATGAAAPSYAELIAGRLEASDVERVQTLFTRQLANAAVSWNSAYYVLRGVNEHD